MYIHRADGPSASEGRRFAAASRSTVFRLLSVGAIALATPIATRADNSYATMLQNNAMMQANLTQQMINLGGRPIGSGGGAAPAGPPPCLPPFELQRGVDGHVPPELQGDPQYQAYLRCREASPARDVRTMPQTPAGSPVAHLPITATDFVPARPGHPFVDQAIAGIAGLTPEQRVQVRNGAEELFRRVATQYRGNNLAVSVTVAYAAAMLTLNGTEMNAQQTREFVFGVNDRLARHPRFATMTALEKQKRIRAADLPGLRRRGAARARHARSAGKAAGDRARARDDEAVQRRLRTLRATAGDPHPRTYASTRSSA